MTYKENNFKAKGSNSCKDCEWWEFEKNVKTKQRGTLAVGICQVRDDERTELRWCKNFKPRAAEGVQDG